MKTFFIIIISGVLFFITGCNKKVIPSLENTETNTTEEKAENEQSPPIKVEAIPAPQNIQIKKFDVEKLKQFHPADSSAPSGTNPDIVQPRPVGAPIEAKPKNP
jgi:hypothetical protein